MSKLVALVLVVALLLSPVLPGWGAPSPELGVDGVESVVAGSFHLLGGCDDGGGSNCDYG